MKAKKVVALTLLAILLLSAFACGGGGEQVATPTPTPIATPAPTPTPVPGFETFTDVVNGFSISYPEDWEIPPEPLWEGALVAFWAPVACGEFVANFNLVAEELPYAMSVKTYFAAAKRQVGALEGYTPISEDDMTVSGQAAVKHVCTYVYGGQTIKAMQVCVVKGTTAWALTFTTVPPCWTRYESTFDTMVDGFQLLE